MVAMLDADHSGKLGFEEFKTLWNDIRKWRVSAKSFDVIRKFLSCKIFTGFCNAFKWRIFQAVFKLYDRDESGYLSAFELRQALNSAGYRLNNHILNILVHRYGTKDGKITFDDYIMCAVRLKTMIGKRNLIINLHTLMIYQILTDIF